MVVGYSHYISNIRTIYWELYFPLILKYFKPPVSFRHLQSFMFCSIITAEEFASIIWRHEFIITKGRVWLPRILTLFLLKRNLSCNESGTTIFFSNHAFLMVTMKPEIWASAPLCEGSSHWPKLLSFLINTEARPFV